MKTESNVKAVARVVLEILQFGLLIGAVILLLFTCIDWLTVNGSTYTGDPVNGTIYDRQFVEIHSDQPVVAEFGSEKNFRLILEDGSTLKPKFTPSPLGADKEYKGSYNLKDEIPVGIFQIISEDDEIKFVVYDNTYVTTNMTVSDYLTLASEKAIICFAVGFFLSFLIWTKTS